jgi:hypothetical protein
MAEGLAHRADASLRRGGEPVTLTIGQTFVQVVPLSYDVSIREGKPIPPVTAVAGLTRPAAR